MHVSYATATTANGFLATLDDSLAWLFAVTGETPDLDALYAAIDAFVMGSSTYEWLLRDRTLNDDPDGWTSAFGDRPVVVFTTRALPVPDGADVRFLSGPVADNAAALRDISGNGAVWVQGGGDLAGQFLDADMLDEITLHISPAFLSEGKPLLPRELEPDRLTLVEVHRTGQFIEATWQVS
jgi:dihydrofolate reductase